MKNEKKCFWVKIIPEKNPIRDVFPFHCVSSHCVSSHCVSVHCVSSKVSCGRAAVQEHGKNMARAFFRPSCQPSISMCLCGMFIPSIVETVVYTHTCICMYKHMHFFIYQCMTKNSTVTTMRPTLQLVWRSIAWRQV